MIGIPVTLARQSEMTVKDDRVNWSDWNTCYSGQGDDSER